MSSKWNESVPLALTLLLGIMLFAAAIEGYLG